MLSFHVVFNPAFGLPTLHYIVLHYIKKVKIKATYSKCAKHNKGA